MMMPEAAMDQDHFPQSWEYKIGRAGQIAPVKTVSEAQTVCETANCDLGTGVPSSYAGHQ